MKAEGWSSIKPPCALPVAILSRLLSICFTLRVGSGALALKRSMNARNSNLVILCEQSEVTSSRKVSGRVEILDRSSWDINRGFDNFCSSNRGRLTSSKIFTLF